MSISTKLTELINVDIRRMKTKHMAEQRARSAGTFSQVLPNGFRHSPLGKTESPMMCTYCSTGRDR